MQASLKLLLLAPARVTVPIWATIWRALFGCCESVIWLVGRTGVFKSELAALAQQHYGRGMDARHFPQNWASTANDIELTLFAAKDALAVVDDFAPGITRGSRQELENKAERVMRGLGNAAGRGRMTADGRQRPDRPPRAQVIVTGEDLPALHSIRARALIVPVAEGDVDTALLTEAQETAGRASTSTPSRASSCGWRAGTSRSSTAGASSPPSTGTSSSPRACTAAPRSPWPSSWPRSRSSPSYLDEQGIEIPPEVLEHLGEEADIGDGAADPAHGTGADGLARASRSEQQRGADPVRLFVETLGEALASGRAHVLDVSTHDAPARHPELLGFRKRAIVSGGLETRDVGGPGRARRVGRRRIPLPQPAGRLRRREPAPGRAGDRAAEEARHALGRAATPPAGSP